MEESFFTKNKDSKKVKTVLVGVVLQNDDKQETENSIAELERLLDTAGGECIAVLIQSKTVPDSSTYIGSGKTAELKELCANNDAELIVFDAELTPSQIKNLEKETDVHVIDRSMLILDIFALHAVTNEGKLQVELAQLKYTIPRLFGKGTELSRLGGGIGTRGPGESKLETDKRHIMRRITALETELKEIEKNRSVQRKARERSNTFNVAIAGYTNAGKSTLLNRLTDAGILAEDKLFATLDPTTRRFKLESGKEILLTDTVGFIKKLPHQLIKAFRSTLEEVKYADALIILADATDDDVADKLKVSTQLIEELNAEGKPILYVFNKCDAIDSAKKDCLPGGENTVFISAKTGYGIEDLKNKIEKLVSDGKFNVKFLFPMSEQSFLTKLYKSSIVSNVEYRDNGVLVTAAVDAKVKGQLEKYIVS